MDNNYNLYFKMNINREDCSKRDFKEIRIIRNDNTELVVENFSTELEPMFFVAEGLLDNRQHLVTEDLKPLFVEQRDELVKDLYTSISNSATDLADNIIDNFNKGCK